MSIVKSRRQICIKCKNYFTEYGDERFCFSCRSINDLLKSIFESLPESTGFSKKSIEKWRNEIDFI